MPGGYTFDRLRDALSLRIKAMPNFREKLANSFLNLDHPVWVDDKDFDIDRHLHRIGLPAPGGRVELAEICGHIASLAAGPQPPAVGDVGDRGRRRHRRAQTADGWR